MKKQLLSAFPEDGKYLMAGAAKLRRSKEMVRDTGLSRFWEIKDRYGKVRVSMIHPYTGNGKDHLDETQDVVRVERWVDLVFSMEKSALSQVSFTIEYPVKPTFLTHFTDKGDGLVAGTTRLVDANDTATVFYSHDFRSQQDETGGTWTHTGETVMGTFFHYHPVYRDVASGFVVTSNSIINANGVRWYGGRFGYMNYQHGANITYVFASEMGLEDIPLPYGAQLKETLNDIPNEVRHQVRFEVSGTQTKVTFPDRTSYTGSYVHEYPATNPDQVRFTSYPIYLDGFINTEYKGETLIGGGGTLCLLTGVADKWTDYNRIIGFVGTAKRIGYTGYIDLQEKALQDRDRETFRRYLRETKWGKAEQMAQSATAPWNTRALPGIITWAGGVIAEFGEYGFQLDPLEPGDQVFVALVHYYNANGDELVEPESNGAPAFADKDLNKVASVWVRGWARFKKGASGFSLAGWANNASTQRVGISGLTKTPNVLCLARKRCAGADEKTLAWLDKVTAQVTETTTDPLYRVVRQAIA